MNGLPNIPARNRNLENAKGFSEFRKQLEFFMRTNNFSENERLCVMHLLNSFYFMGKDIENYRPF
jgi:hypothetical protein